MNVNKKELAKSQLEIVVELSYEEFKPYIDKDHQVYRLGCYIEVAPFFHVSIIDKKYSLID